MASKRHGTTCSTSTHLTTDTGSSLYHPCHKYVHTSARHLCIPFPFLTRQTNIAYLSLSLCRFIANNDEWIHMNSYYTQEHSPSQGAQREVDHLHIWCTFDENIEYHAAAGGEFKIGNSNRHIVVVQLFLLLFIRLQFCKWFTSMTFPLFTEMTCSDGTWHSWLLETMMHSARYEMTDEQDKKLERNFPSSLFLFHFHSLPHTVLSSNTTRFFSLATN